MSPALSRETMKNMATMGEEIPIDIDGSPFTGALYADDDAASR